MNREFLYRFLSQQKYGVVSSIGPDGTPQSALVGIAVSPTLEVIFDTAINSRKYRNFLRCNAFSFVVGWSNEQTVQLDGEIELLSNQKLDEAHRLYCSAWPDGESRLVSPDITLLLARPSWARYSDYSTTPAVIEELSIRL